MQMPIPKIAPLNLIRGWTALVLAVSHHSKWSHNDILHHKGRSSERVAGARRLLCCAFMEVTELDLDLAAAWLEQCLHLGYRTILRNIERGETHEKLQEVLETYSRLVREMGPKEVRIAALAGILGGRRSWSTVWPRGFLAKLGLTDH